MCIRAAAMPSSQALDISKPRHASSRTPPRTSPRTSQQVRSKFLQKIGIFGKHKSANLPVSERSVRDLRSIPRYQQALKYDRLEEGLREEQRLSRQSVAPASAASSKKPKPKRQVSFDESVVVVPIPMRSEFSDRIRTKLWSDAVEMCESIGKKRNLVEFAAEGYEWRGACNEDEMYMCGVTGELIHPVH
ncbi:hypothetical protein ACHAXT_007940, partial [Thalassiosira profunda]